MRLAVAWAGGGVSGFPERRHGEAEAVSRLAPTDTVESIRQDALDITDRFTLVLGGRWDYSAREGNVDNFSPVGPPTRAAQPARRSGRNWATLRQA